MKKKANLLFGLCIGLAWALAVVGCTRPDPVIGVIQINRDFPIVSSGLLRIGVTLNPGTTTGRDLLDPNLLINGSFDLAQRLAVSLHTPEDTTVTTPNGYRQFYPLPEQLYGWHRSDDSRINALREKLNGEEGGSFFVRVSGIREDTLRLGSIRPIKGLLEGAVFHFRGRIRGRGSAVKVCLVRDSIGGTPVSNELVFVAGEGWRPVEQTLRLFRATESAYLQLTFEPQAVTLTGDSLTPGRSRRSGASPYLDLDDLFLSREEVGSLPEVLMGLDPDFIRFPDGLTSGGFYPGTFPLRDTPQNEHIPIWTSTGYGYTGVFGLKDFISLADSLKAQPILIENAGFTNAGIGRRMEDLALLPERVRYLERVLERADADSLLLQIGYDMPSSDYPGRFREMTRIFERDTVSPYLITGGMIVPPDGTEYSDIVADLALPALTSPDFMGYIPEALRSSFSQTQPIMLGEVHFTEGDPASPFLTSFILRAAFLIEAERHADILKGVSLYPLLSELQSESPLILVEENAYTPTPLYRYLQDFIHTRGSEVRQIDNKSLYESGIYGSLTSDHEETHFFLKAANVTRHPLTYLIKSTGTKKPSFSEARITRYMPVGLSPDTRPERSIPYTVSQDTVRLSIKQSFPLTIGPYEAVIVHLE